MPPDRATWFITAAATGFGREVAVRALAGGANVEATAAGSLRRSDLWEGLARELARPGLEVVIIEGGPLQTSLFNAPRHVGATTINDYDATAGLYGRHVGNSYPWPPSDRARGAQAIGAIAAAEEPPLRGPEHDTATANVRSHLAEIEQWPALPLSAARPDAAGRPRP